MAEFYLFGTQACHLCEEAAFLLTSMQIEFEFKDILEQADWQEKYSLSIPVLFHAKSQTQLDWPFDSVAVQDYFSTDLHSF
jgi:hypothetical protein